jgi:hypothetical protein
MAVQFGIAVIIAIPIRQCVAMPFHVKTAAVAPEVPQGSWALVNRLAMQFKPGDIIAYHDEGRVMLARVTAERGGLLSVTRDGKALDIDLDRIVGRVVLATR